MNPFSSRFNACRLLLGSTGIALLSLACNVQAAPHQMPPAKVPVQTLKPQSVSVYQTFPGTTQANRHVVVRAQVNGILEKRAYTEGAKVNKGDVLFRIDPSPYNAALHQAQANVASAEASLRSAKRDWDRIRSLFKRGVASVKDRDDAKSALEIAQASVKVAKAKVEQASVDVRYTHVDAPISGIASLRAVSVGNLVKPGDKLAEIDQVDPLQVVMTYSADSTFAKSPALNPGPNHPTSATLVGVTGKDGQTITGKINYRAASVDESTNTITLRAIFPNADDLLKPNQFVRVRVRVAQRHHAIVIPETAITNGEKPGSTAVFTVNKNNKVTLVPVQLGQRSEKGRIVNSGLHAGDRLVTDGLIKLHPGATINPITGQHEPGKSQQPNNGKHS